MIPSPASSSSTERSRKNSKKRGRPKTWAGALLSELLALDVFTHLTNDQLLRSLRGTTDGTRSLQGLRKHYFGPATRCWRSQGAAQTHRRICHLRSQCRPGTGPRVFSLNALNLRHIERCSAPDLTSNAIRGPQIDHQSDFNRLTFRLVKSTQSESRQIMLKIRLTKDSTKYSTHVCALSDIDSTIYQIYQPSGLDPSKHLQTLSAIFSYVDLSTHPLLDAYQSFGLMCNRLTRLALNNCRLRTVPRLVKQFSKLEYLNISRNRLSKISSLQLPHSLTFLDVRQNQISKLPEELLNLRSLRVFAVSHNSLHEFPTWISDWTNLRILFSNGNPLNAQSYSAYHKAFKHCKLEGEFESCSACLSLATQELKEQLSGRPKRFAQIDDQILSCTCQRFLEAPIVLPTINLTDTEGRSQLNIDPHDYGNDITDFKAFVRRMSFLTDSSRSSVTELTIRSVSSAGSHEQVPRLDIQNLMLVHCCLREDGDIRPLCMHRRISSWMDQGCKTQPPRTALLELDMTGSSALHVAASWGAPPAALRSCIHLGCSPNVINDNGETFMHLASGDGWDPSGPATLVLIRDLHEKNFPFGHRDHRGNNILHKSGKMRDVLQISHLTLARKCSLQRNAAGQLYGAGSTVGSRCPTVWFDCCIDRPVASSSTARLFMQTLHPTVFSTHSLPTEPGRCNSQCETTHLDPLHAMARLISLGYQEFMVPGLSKPWTCEETLRTILESCDMINNYNTEGLTALMAFMRALGRRQRILGDEQVKACIKLLLDSGADVRWVSRHGDTSLHYAIYHGLPLAIEPLIKAGANVNARNYKGLSVMQLLFETMHKIKANRILFASLQQCMAILADHGAEVEPTVKQELRLGDEDRCIRPESLQLSRSSVIWFEEEVQRRRLEELRRMEEEDDW